MATIEGGEIKVRGAECVWTWGETSTIRDSTMRPPSTNLFVSVPFPPPLYCDRENSFWSLFLFGEGVTQRLRAGLKRYGDARQPRKSISSLTSKRHVRMNFVGDTRACCLFFQACPWDQEEQKARTWYCGCGALPPYALFSAKYPLTKDVPKEGFSCPRPSLEKSTVP